MFNITSTHKYIATLTLLLMLGFPFMSSAETVIENNISVKAGDGAATAHVKSVINGEVVENITISDKESISYQSSHTVENDQMTISSSSPAIIRDGQLQVLLNRLVSLLSLYVSKLAS